MKTLLVNKSKPVRKRIRSLFQEFIPNVGEIYESDNGIDASNIIDREQPDFVILDVNISPAELNGLRLLRKMQGMAKRPVSIVFTDYKDENVRGRCLSNGAMYFFDKTGDIDSIINLIRDRCKFSLA